MVLHKITVLILFLLLMLEESCMVANPSILHLQLQNYFKLNPNQPYCMMVVNPKVRKFRKEFADRLKVAD